MDFQSFAAERTEELKGLVREALDRNREQVEAEISRLAESFFANMEDAYKASTEESWFDRVGVDNTNSTLSELEDQLEADILAKKEEALEKMIYKACCMKNGRIPSEEEINDWWRIKTRNFNTERFTPKRADIYWAIDLSHGPQEKWWAGAEDDIHAHAIGNCFKTKQEAIDGLERIKELLLR
jgi:hypothetical protein